MKTYLLIPVLLLLVVIQSCKKVDDAQRYNQSLPTVSGGGSSYVTGDTLSLIGRLFYETGTLKIHIGSADAKIVAHSQSSVNYYGNNTLFDQVKVVLTPEMGVGNNIPVTITANGHSIDAAPINISKFIPVTGVTDTTLFVDKLLTWAPADLSPYQFTDTTIKTRPKITTLPIVIRSTVNSSGNISFFNPVGVFSVKNANVSPVIQAGDSFTENGQQFSIRYVIGATNTANPDVYYFSAEVLEAGHNTYVSLVYRLCKFDATSKTVTTLNRTEVKNFPTGAPVDARPFQGEAASVKLVACNLKEGANGDLFFINYFPLENSQRGLYRWYLSFTQQIANTGGHSNLCNYKDGKIVSLFSDHNITDGFGFNAPGAAFRASTDYLLSPDGNTIIINNIPGGSTDRYLVYDLAKKAPFYTFGDRNLRFKSYDTDPATRILSGSIFISANNSFSTPVFVNNFCYTGAILPNGDLLFNYGTSLGSFNFLVNNGYCYAGEEIGFNGNGSPQLTDFGKAKHVDFFNKIMFGTDRSLNFYFFKPDYSSSPYTVTFYKMYSKK